MLRIHQALLSGGFPNATKLAREIEVATKTIHRDIEFMRDRLNLPIEFDPANNGYFYTEEVSAFPTMQITEGELFALVVAEKALQQYRGTSFEKPLLSAIKKMEQALPDTISLNLADIEQTISFRTRAEPILDLKIFDALAKAVAQRQQIGIELSQARPGQNRSSACGSVSFGEHQRRMVSVRPRPRAQRHPHFCSGANPIRQSPPARPFDRPQKFSLEKRLRDSFGVHSGEGEFEVVIRFNARAADYVREKKWHESQQLRELKGGGVELKLKLSSLAEIERWVLSWGGDAKVFKPRELAEAVRKSARAILKQPG